MGAKKCTVKVGLEALRWMKTSCRSWQNGMTKYCIMEQKKQSRKIMNDNDTWTEQGPHSTLEGEGNEGRKQDIRPTIGNRQGRYNL